MPGKRPFDALDLRGAALGVALGLVLTLIGSLFRHLTPASPVVAVSSGGSSASGPGVGVVRVLAPSDSSVDGIVSPGPRETAFQQIGSALRHAGAFGSSLEIATQLEQGPDRDEILRGIADQTLPAYDYQDDLKSLLQGQGDRTVVLEKLHRLRRIADLAGDPLKVGLLIRMAVYKKAIDEAFAEAQHPKKDVTPSPDTLFREAVHVARRLESSASAESSSIWNWGLLLTGILGFLGFVTSNLIAPILTAFGEIVGASIAEGFGTKNLTTSPSEGSTRPTT